MLGLENFEGQGRDGLSEVDGFQGMNWAEGWCWLEPVGFDSSSKEPARPDEFARPDVDKVRVDKRRGGLLGQRSGVVEVGEGRGNGLLGFEGLHGVWGLNEVRWSDEDVVMGAGLVEMIACYPSWLEG